MSISRSSRGAQTRAFSQTFEANLCRATARTEGDASAAEKRHGRRAQDVLWKICVFISPMMRVRSSGRPFSMTNWMTVLSGEGRLQASAHGASDGRRLLSDRKRPDRSCRTGRARAAASGCASR